MDSTAYPDPRQRGKVAFHAPSSAAPGAYSSRIPTDLLLALLLTKTTMASSALLARHWLLTSHSEGIHSPASSAASSSRFSATQQPLFSNRGEHGHASAWAIATFAFFLASLGQATWFRVWTWLPSLRRSDPNLQVLPKKISWLALVLFSHIVVWLLALQHLGALTVIIFTQFCEVWASDLARSIRNRSYGGYTILTALCLSFLWCLVTGVSSPNFDAQNAGSSLFSSPYDDDDLPPSLQHTRAGAQSSSSSSSSAQVDAASFSPGGVLVGHAWLVAYALLTLERERATASASRESGGRRRATVMAGVVGAAVTMPLSVLGSLLGLSTLPPLSSLAPTFTAFTSSPSHLPAYVLLAGSFLILEPLVSTTLERHASLQTRVLQGWPIAVLACSIVGFVGFGLKTGWGIWAIAGTVAWGLRSILKYSPHLQPSAAAATRAASTSSQADAGDGGSALAELARTSRDFLVACRRTVRIIMANDDSRKIFQFLCLNLAFMGVQLVWGVWTNSLGLISDAIHMFFDCAAIGMGLFASVMSTWGQDQVFTYGYNRVETLSGFSNGIFLILISIFIVFEAVQRIIEPPIMHNTVQLLIVSGMGLAVNLFGMFAMGGHHHHGHSHGGGGCGGGHSHDHGHGHGGHDHGHSHNMMGVYLHVMADTLGSVGVIVSTLLIEYYGWTGFDPIASLFIAFMIVISVIPLVVESGKILCLELPTETEASIAAALQDLQGVHGLAGFSNPRFWPKDGETVVGSIHLQVLCAPDEHPSANGNGSANGSGTGGMSRSWSASSATSTHSMTIPAPNGSGSGGAATPLIKPEELARQVTRLFKERVPALESLAVQLERGGSAPGGTAVGAGAGAGMMSASSSMQSLPGQSHSHSHAHGHGHGHGHGHAHAPSETGMLRSDSNVNMNMMYTTPRKSR